MATTAYHHTRARRELIESLLPVICPPDPSPVSMAADLVRHTELSFRAFPGPARAALLAGMHTYDQAARLWPGNAGRPARQLPLEQAKRYFASWWSSRLAPQREFARGVKGLICLAYYESPAVKAHLGYTPEAWIDEVKARRLAVYSDDIELAARAVTTPDPLPPLS